MGWGRQASVAVVEKVANAEGTEPMALEPSLYEAIDPEALDRLVESADRSLTVVFTFSGYTVRVDESANVTLTPVEENDDSDRESPQGTYS